MSLFKKSVAFIVVLLILDQVIKVWIKTHMMLGEEFSICGDWFLIHFIENNGMAFGMELEGEWGKILLSLFRIFAVCGIGWYLYDISTKKAPLGLVISIALIFSGAMGNIIDSAFYGLIFNDSHHQIASFFPAEGGYGTLFHGKVVDMLHFPLWEGFLPKWFPFWGGEYFTFFDPVFNIADMAISTGFGLLIVFNKKAFPKEIEKPIAPISESNDE